MIIPTQNVEYARNVCDMAMVLQNGALELFKDVDEAFNAVGPQRGRRARRRSNVDG